MKKGFTLIELMIVISVIGILSAIMLSVINVNRVRGRAQDAVRRQDISTIAGALERYYSDANSYPLQANYVNASSLGGSLVSKYLRQLPVDPTPLSSNYWYRSDGQNYCLCFTSTVEPADSRPATCTDPQSGSVNVCITNTF